MVQVSVSAVAAGDDSGPAVPAPVVTAVVSSRRLESVVVPWVVDSVKSYSARAVSYSPDSSWETEEE